jgi:hypothetical protein
VLFRGGVLLADTTVGSQLSCGGGGASAIPVTRMGLCCSRNHAKIMKKKRKKYTGGMKTMIAWFKGQFTECYSVVVILVCGSFGPVLRYLQRTPILRPMRSYAVMF